LQERKVRIGALEQARLLFSFYIARNASGQSKYLVCEVHLMKAMVALPCRATERYPVFVLLDETDPFIKKLITDAAAEKEEKKKKKDEEKRGKKKKKEKEVIDIHFICSTS